VIGHLLSLLIHRLGPLGVGLGAALEGETAVVIGGALARHGLFHPVAGGLAAWAGSFLADQVVFWVSRRERRRPFVRRLTEKPAVVRAFELIERWPRLFSFGFRFLYGFRIAGPAAAGLSTIPARLFLVLNALSAALWASLFTFAGYRFGPAVVHALRRLLYVPHLGVELAIFALAATALLFAGSKR